LETAIVIDVIFRDRVEAGGWTTLHGGTVLGVGMIAVLHRGRTFITTPSLFRLEAGIVIHIRLGHLGVAPRLIPTRAGVVATLVVSTAPSTIGDGFTQASLLTARQYVATVFGIGAVLLGARTGITAPPLLRLEASVVILTLA
jgi:hypothetical protein